MIWFLECHHKWIQLSGCYFRIYFGIPIIEGLLYSKCLEHYTEYFQKWHVFGFIVILNMRKKAKKEWKRTLFNHQCWVIIKKEKNLIWWSYSITISIYMNKSHFLPQYKITKPDNSFFVFLKASLLMKYFHMLSRLFQREQLLVSTFES